MRRADPILENSEGEVPSNKRAEFVPHWSTCWSSLSIQEAAIMQIKGRDRGPPMRDV